MNILYIDHYAGSFSMGMEFRLYYMTREWQKLGHKVWIAAADYSHVRTKQPEVSSRYSIKNIDGVDFLIIKAGHYEGNGAKRAISIFKFVGRLWLYTGHIVRELNPDVVISSSTYPLDCYPAIHIAKRCHGKYIHEAHDIWPLTLIELGGMSRKHPFVVLLDRAEKHAYKKCEKVISLLPDVWPHMREQGLQSESKLICIPNGVVMEDWDHTEELGSEHKSLFDQLHSEGKFVIEYLGGHALSNALDQLLDAAKMADNDTVFVLIGKGVEKSRLQKRASDEQIRNVYFLPPIPKRQVPNALREADALYIGAEHSPLYRFGVSMNKMYDYMMSGKPVLNGVVASNNEVEEAGCGISFDSSKPEEIAAAVRQIMSMTKEERDEMGRRGYDWVRENRDYKKLAKQFIDFIEK